MFICVLQSSVSPARHQNLQRETFSEALMSDVFLTAFSPHVGAFKAASITLQFYVVCVSVAQAQGERAAGYSPAAGEGVLLVSGPDTAAVALSAHCGQTSDRGRAQGDTASLSCSRPPAYTQRQNTKSV